MNNPSPLIPQGATPPRAKSSLYVKILAVLSIHVIVIGGMLMQGCRDTTKEQAKTDGSGTLTNDTPSLANTTPMTGSPSTAIAEVPPVVNPNLTNVLAGTTTSSAPLTPPVAAPITGNSSMSPGLLPKLSANDLNPPGEAKEYTIAKGDLLATIAKKNGVSLKALKEANPGLDPKKLQIGHKIQIPAGTAALAATKATTPGAEAEVASSDASVYVVKSGDMLLKIAKSHGTTVKKIMAMNELKSTSIHIGQKLKLPAKSAEAAPMTPNTASVTATTPAPSRVSSTTPVSAGSTVAAN